MVVGRAHVILAIQASCVMNALKVSMSNPMTMAEWFASVSKTAVVSTRYGKKTRSYSIKKLLSISSCFRDFVVSWCRWFLVTVWYKILVIFACC